MSRSCIFWVMLLGARVLAGPAIRPQDIEVLPVLQERIPSITLGSYDLSTSYINDVLFDFTQKSTIDANGGESFGLKLSCISCITHGNAIVSTTGVSKDTSILNDIKSFFENPLDLIASAFGLNVKVSFENVSGYFDFGIEAKENTTYSFPIFSSSTPVGAAVSEEVSLGMVLFVDLVISLSERVDMEAGFEFAFPEGAYVTVDPLAGKIVDHGFTGGETNALPVTVTSGSATFKAALRVRVQAGTTVILFGTGFDFELGVFADLIEYQATISSTPACELSITEGLDVNIGAFAHAVGEINYSTFGANPAVVTTILEVPLPSLCLTRPAATSVIALPTDSAVPAGPTSSVLPVPSLVVSVGTAPLATHVISTLTNSTGGLFFQASTTTFPTLITASSSIPSGMLYTPPVANGTIASAPALTTSTLYATDVVTLTSCSNNVLHCPASLTAEIVVTKSKILYTTICPVGASLPSDLPADLLLPTTPPSTSIPILSLSNKTLSTSHTIIIFTTTILHTTSPILPSTSPDTTKTLATIALISPLKFTPCPSPVVETVYVPTFTNPIYTIPTATVFPVPFPNWNASVGFTPLSSSLSTVTVSLLAVASSKLVAVENVAPESIGTYEAPKTTLGLVGLERIENVSVGVSTTGALPSATMGLIPFTGAAGRLAGDDGVLLVACLGLGLLSLL